MDTVLSRDGTRIAYSAAGDGPPLLLVHGTTADHTRWKSISSVLGKKFTVYAVDRRGRGESGDTLPYSMEREFEDIAAVIDAIGKRVNVLGHSYGAICSLEAARLTRNIAKLILYEPPIPAGVEIYPPGVAERIQALADGGDQDGAVSTFFREIVRMPHKELDLLRSLPAWKARVAAAYTIPREMTASGQYQYVPERFRDLTVPILILLGGSSPLFLTRAANLLSDTLPNSCMAVMPDQQHAAIDTAQELFISEMQKFLLLSLAG